VFERQFDEERRMVAGVLPANAQCEVLMAVSRVEVEMAERMEKQVEEAD
jgi:hypothetical protein